MRGRIFCAALAAWLISGAASAQLLSVSAALSPRPLPSGVSIPAIAPTDVVYPGCPTPPTSFGTVWHIDSVNGHTSAGGGTGAIGSPWNSLQAVFSLQSGYTTPLLSTVSGSTGPIHPGDEIVLNTGNYGTITGDSTVNSPALTIAAGASQTPVLSRFVLTKSSGYVLDGSLGDFQVSSLNSGSNFGLIDIANNDPGAETNFVFNHMDVFSASVATSNGWTQSQWQNNAYTGIQIRASVTCASVTNSHIYVTQFHNGAAIQDLASSALIQGNEVDHFATDMVGIDGSNIGIINNYAHDSVLVWPFDNYYWVRNNQLFTTALQNNITISGNEIIESTPASGVVSALQAPISGVLNSSGDITNATIYDNLVVESSCGQQGLLVNSIHDSIIANNSLMDVGCASLIEVNTGHGGTTGPEGQPPSNVAIFNNIAGFYETYGPNVQFYNNIATQPTAAPNAAWAFQWGYALPFVFSTPGSITALTTQALSGPPNTSFAVDSTIAQYSGLNNMLDGKGPSDVFTSIPSNSTYPWTTSPNWTPISGHLAKTMGGAVLIPPINDFNGVPFASPYSIGALN